MAYIPLAGYVRVSCFLQGEMCMQPSSSFAQKRLVFLLILVTVAITVLAFLSVLDTLLG